MRNILAFPKYGDTRNPVLLNLNRHFEDDKELEIDEFNLFKPFKKRYDIFHIHWPDYFFVKSLPYTIIRIIYFLTILCIFKIRRTKLIWTVHNLQPHNNYHPKLNSWIMNIFTKYINGYIVMSEESKRLAIQKYPNLESKKSTLIYHGLYDNYKNNISKEDARKKLGIHKDKKVLLYFGRVDKYKNIPILVSEFNKLDDEYILLIAGNCKDIELKEEIKQHIGLNENIKTYFRFIEDNEVQYFFNACDLVVLPFKNILNSGSAMLALSFKKPLFCPNIGSIKELKGIFGKSTINTYNIFSLKYIESLTDNSTNPLDEILIKFNNKTLAKQLKEVYLGIN